MAGKYGDLQKTFPLKDYIRLFIFHDILFFE